MGGGLGLRRSDVRPGLGTTIVCDDTTNKLSVNVGLATTTVFRFTLDTESARDLYVTREELGVLSENVLAQVYIATEHEDVPTGVFGAWNTSMRKFHFDMNDYGGGYFQNGNYLIKVSSSGSRLITPASYTPVDNFGTVFKYVESAERPQAEPGTIVIWVEDPDKHETTESATAYTDIVYIESTEQPPASAGKLIIWNQLEE